MNDLSSDNQADVIKAFNLMIFSTLTILILKEWSTKYPPELQHNKANTIDTEAPFLDLHLSIFNDFVSSKIYDKRDDFYFDIVNFPF